jgi:hypothetical protein
VIRTSRRDKNYVSVNNGTVLFDYGTHVDASQQTLDGDLLVPPNKTYDGTLKFSQTSNYKVVSLYAASANESSLDINNHCTNLAIQGTLGQVGDVLEHPVTIKGAADVPDSKIVLTLLIRSRGKNFDVILGDWSDESYNVLRGVVLNIAAHPDGKPIRVVLGRAVKPLMTANCEVLFWWSLGLKIYWWAKWLLVKTVYRWFPKLDPQAGT